ncbi:MULTISPECIES: hypothetical protein [unclassified Bradyrhizobium]|uniref:hypothetical protein n=1 Tax=unclassified Bradyrhizobium TaxID=2631580 RepID=UPI001FF88934|nr:MULTISPECIES: hypothetical protein [unclassified Bradyrhizobium]
MFRGYLLHRDRSAVLHAGLGNADVSKQRTFDEARTLGVYPNASADQFAAKRSRQVAQCGLRRPYGRSDLIGQRSREADRVSVASERRRVLNIEIESREIDSQDVKAVLRCFRERPELHYFGIGIEMGYNVFPRSFEAG